MDTIWTPLISSLIFAGVGIVALVVGFAVLDLLTPGKLWQEINEKQNNAVAIFAGAVAIALAIIIAAAIHG